MEMAINQISFTKDQLILGVFSVVMILASISMIRGRKEKQVSEQSELKNPNFLLVGLEGLLVGGLTGFVGAGGVSNNSSLSASY